MDNKTEIESPRIAALSEALSTGDGAALETFWAQAAAAGGPLIEPLADPKGYALVTFVWRAQEETRSVAVGGGLMGLDPSENQLARLRDSDLWYRSYRARTDLRTRYCFAVNIPAIPIAELMNDEKQALGLLARLRPDPLNPHRLVRAGKEPPLGIDSAFSVLELPDASPQPWVEPRPNVLHGRVESHTLGSRILGNERRVWVYTPPGYSPEAPGYELLLVLDGDSHIRAVPTPTILDNLLSEGKIPPMVAVLPSNVNLATRNKELPCYAPHADFVVTELLPFVRERYSITREPARTFIAGSSYGGLASSYTAFRHPKVFGNVLSQSGSYWWKPEGDEEQEWLTKQFATARRKPIRFYMDVGLLESSTNHCPVSQLISNRHLRDVLRAKGYPVHYVEYMGGHDIGVWRGTLSDGLLALLDVRRA